jgi:hypothetical protein
MTGMEIAKRAWNSHWRTALFAGLGAAGGVAYYQLAAVAGFPSARAPEAGPDEARPR